MQKKYTWDFLSRFNMLDSKLVTTPLLTSPKLTLHSGDPLSNPTQYRQLVGGLQSFHTARDFLCSKSPMIIYASTNYRALDRHKTSPQVPLKISYSWDPLALEKSIDITCVLWCRLGWRTGRIRLKKCIHHLHWRTTHFLVIAGVKRCFDPQ